MVGRWVGCASCSQMMQLLVSVDGKHDSATRPTGTLNASACTVVDVKLDEYELRCDEHWCFHTNRDRFPSSFRSSDA